MSKIGVVDDTIQNKVGLPSVEADLVSLARTVTAIREQVQILTGEQGATLDRVVTLNDLVDLEVLQAALDSNFDINSLTAGAAIGENTVVGFADGSVLWIQQSGGGSWAPSTPQDIVVSFRRGDVEIASHTVRGALNTGTGAITITTNATSGDATTLNVTGDVTTSPIVSVTHDDSSTAVPVSFGAVQGGTTGPSGADGADGADGSDGRDGVVPPDATWGAGLTDIVISINEDAAGLADDGEIHLEPGTLRLPDGVTRTLAADAEVYTPYEGATVPPPAGGTFYLVWGTSSPAARFGGVIADWGNVTSVNAGLFAAYYSDALGWNAADDTGTTYSFTPSSDDLLIGIGFKTSGSGGIDSFSPLIVYTGDLGLLDTIDDNVYLGPDIVEDLNIVDRTITNLQIALDTIETINIAPLAITEAEIDDRAIVENKIALNTITGDNVALDTILGANIADGAVTSAEIAVNTILGSNIAPDTITGSLIAADTIAGGNILGGTITGTNIAADTISGGNILGRSVGADKLVANSITVDEMGANSIDTDQLVANSVEAGKIAADAVDTNEIAAGAIETEQLAANSITSTKILAGEVKAGNIDALAVTAGKIAANAVIAGNVAANAIQAGALQANSVTATNIQANAVTASKINVSELSAITANVGYLTSGVIEAGLVSTGVLDAQVINLNGSTLSSSAFGLFVSNLGITNAQIANATITTAKIGTAQVDRLRIGDNAVTLPVYSNPGSQPIPASTWGTIASASLTPAETSDIAVFFTANIDKESGGSNTLFYRIQRNGVTVYGGTGNDRLAIPNDTEDGAGTWAIVFTDANRSGLNTYTIQLDPENTVVGTVYTPSLRLEVLYR